MLISNKHSYNKFLKERKTIKTERKERKNGFFNSEKYNKIKKYG